MGRKPKGWRTGSEPEVPAPHPALRATFSRKGEKG